MIGERRHETRMAVYASCSCSPARSLKALQGTSTSCKRGRLGRLGRG